MPDSNQYAWDFDRPSDQLLETFSTFSVGIFQWLTKASGKGMKKSKAIARVLGYTAEPERVYAKAVELCSRLNREAASANVPPEWLQKQYSVPRPEGMVIEKISADFTGAQVRSIRLRVMKNHLLAAGFVVGKDASYVRRHGEQIHLINFQANKYGHSFTVNMGFHYCFIPPHFHMRSLPLTDFHELDCALRERIGHFLPERRDVWFQYGQDRDVLISNLVRCATTCLAVFDRCMHRWSDPSVFLSDFSGVNKSEWDFRPKDLALACVALRIANFEEARARLERWKSDDIPERSPLYLWLSNKLGELREWKGESGKCVPLPDWVVSTVAAQL